MECIEVRPPPPPERSRVYEHASSKVAAIQSGEISQRPPAQMPGLQRHASAVLTRRETPTEAARRRYRCDRYPPLPLPAAGSRHKPEPSAILARSYARYQAKPERSPNRKLQMLLSAQR